PGGRGCSVPASVVTGSASNSSVTQFHAGAPVPAASRFAVALDPDAPRVLYPDSPSILGAASRASIVRSELESVPRAFQSQADANIRLDSPAVVSAVVVVLLVVEDPSAVPPV